MKTASFLWLVVFIVLVVWVHVAWARYRLKEWAKEQGFVITSQRLCLGRIGPFSYFGTSGGQSVFRIEIFDREGRARSGYARVGGFFFGLMRKRVEVKWDKPLLDEIMSE